MREDIRQKFIEALKKIKVEDSETFIKGIFAYIKEDKQAVLLTNYINDTPNITESDFLFTVVAIDQKEEGITKAINKIVLEE